MLTYRLDDETGLLLPVGILNATVLGDVVCLRVKLQSGEEVEGVMALLFLAYKLNKLSRKIFYA